MKNKKKQNKKKPRQSISSYINWLELMKAKCKTELGMVTCVYSTSYLGDSVRMMT